MSEARAIRDLINTDLSQPSWVAVGNAVFSETGNKRVTLDIDVGGTERSFIESTQTFDAGKWYVFLCKVVSCSDNVSGTECQIYYEEVPGEGDLAYGITDADDGTIVGIRFRPAASGSRKIYVGLGTTGNVAKTATLVIEEVVFRELNYLTENFDLFCSTSDEFDNDGYQRFVDIEPEYNFVAGHDGLVTQVVTNEIKRTLDAYAMGLFVGDSQGYAKTHYPYLIGEADNGIGVEINHTGGDELPNIRDALVNAMVGFGLRPSVPVNFSIAEITFVFTNGGINDIATASTDPVPDMISAAEEIITQIVLSGLPGWMSNVGPFNGNGFYTQEREEWRQSYNNYLQLRLRNHPSVRLYDVDKFTRDESDPTRLKAAYNNGDWLHLSAAAQIDVAADIEAVILDRLGTVTSDHLLNVNSTHLTNEENSIFMLESERDNISPGAVGRYHANKTLALKGDCQQISVVLGGQTDNLGFFDLDVGGKGLKLPGNGAQTVMGMATLKLMGARDNGSMAIFEADVMFRWDGEKGFLADASGASNEAPAVVRDVSVIRDDITLTAPRVMLNSGVLGVQVSGLLFTTINWVASMDVKMTLINNA